MRWDLERRSGYPARGTRRTLGRAGIAVSLSLLGAAAVPLSLGACTATRNADGSMSLSFAPDMTITAWGLEDAREQVYDLWQSCLAGTYVRPCSQSEIDDIKETYDDIIERKQELGQRIEEHEGPPTGSAL